MESGHSSTTCTEPWACPPGLIGACGHAVPFGALAALQSRCPVEDTITDPNSGGDLLVMRDTATCTCWPEHVC